MSDREYISCDEVKRRLHCARQHVRWLAAQGMIGMRVITGCAKPRYCAADVERIRHQVIIPARDPSPTTPPKPSKRRQAEMTG
jgi:hypothetical protein